MPKHVHADLMAEYAKDAQTTDMPWLLWEARYISNNNRHQWYTLDTHPVWDTDTEYRRKRKTHIVNGKEVAAPLDKVEEGQIVYSFTLVLVGKNRFPKYIISHTERWNTELIRGLLFATEFDAQENFNAHFPIRNI